MRMSHIVIYGLSGSMMFFHIILQTGTIIQRNIIEHKLFSPKY